MKLIFIRVALGSISLIVVILLLAGIIGKINKDGILVKSAFILASFIIPLMIYKGKLEQQTNNNQKD
jgi:hypothetical protein